MEKYRYTFTMMDQIDKQQLLKILQANPLGMMLVDSDGKVAWVNDNFPIISGISSLQVIDKTVDTVPAEYRELFDGEATINLPALDNRPETWLVVSSQTLDDGSRVQYIKDATLMRQLAKERDELKHKVMELNIVDEVTGLLNPRGLYQALEPQVSRSRRYNNLLSIMIMRIENLEGINDSFGHERSHQLLQAMSEILNDQMRWADSIGRLSDNEFMLIMPETPQDIADHLGGKIRERLSELTVPNLDGETMELSTKVGMVQWQKGEDTRLLMQRARATLNDSEEIHIAVA